MSVFVAKLYLFVVYTESIVKGLTSSDDKVCKTSIQKADEFLNKINADTEKPVSRNIDVEEPDLKTGIDIFYHKYYSEGSSKFTDTNLSLKFS